MNRVGLVTLSLSLLLDGCGGSSGNPQGEAGCSPIEATVSAPDSVESALGIKDYRYRISADVFELELLSNSGDILATLEFGGHETTSLHTARGTHVSAGALVTTIRTADGDTAELSYSAKAEFGNPLPLGPDVSDGEVAIEGGVPRMQITYNGRTLFFQTDTDSPDRVETRRVVAVPRTDAPSEPSLGRETAIFDGENEVVPVYAFDLRNDGELVSDTSDYETWLAQVGLESWIDSITVRMLFAASADPTWWFQAARDTVRCEQGEAVAQEFENAVSSGAELSNKAAADCFVAGSSAFGAYFLFMNPAVGALAATGPVGLAIVGLGAITTGLWIYTRVVRCACTDNDNRVSPWCARCDAGLCDLHCIASLPPLCSQAGNTASGACEERTSFAGVEQTCVCTVTLVDNRFADSCADPHIDTFDRRAYSPQVAGEFVLAETMSGDPLMVQVRQEPYSGSACNNVAINTAVATRIGGAVVFIDGNTGDMRVDNVLVDVGVDEVLEFPDGARIERVDDARYHLFYAGGFAMTVWGGAYTDVALSVPDERADDIHGLLGTPDDDVDNELSLRNRTVLDYPVAWEELVTTFADSWRIDQTESLFYYESGQDTDTFTISGFPPTPATPDDLPANILAEAQAVCDAAGVTGRVALADCILDVGCTGLNEIAGSHLDRSEERIPISQPVDLSTWTIEGPGDPSEWELFTGSTNGEDDADYNDITTEPALLVSDRGYDEFILQWTTGNVSDASEGMVGALFDYEGPLTANGDAVDDYDALLLAWNGTEPDAFATPSAPTGWTLVRLSGVVDVADVASRFYAQQSSPNYQVLATAHAPELGWVNRSGHNVSVVYRRDRIEVTSGLASGGPSTLHFAVEASTLGTQFEAGRIGLLTLGNDLTRWRDVTIAPLR